MLIFFHGKELCVGSYRRWISLVIQFDVSFPSLKFKFEFFLFIFAGLWFALPWGISFPFQVRVMLNGIIVMLWTIVRGGYLPAPASFWLILLLGCLPWVWLRSRVREELLQVEFRWWHRGYPHGGNSCVKVKFSKLKIEYIDKIWKCIYSFINWMDKGQVKPKKDKKKNT